MIDMPLLGYSYKSDPSSDESHLDVKDSDVENQRNKKQSKCNRPNFQDENDVFDLAMNGDLELLNKLSSLTDINKLDSSNFTLLHYATRFQHYQLATQLIQNNAIVTIAGQDAMTPFHLACKHSSDHEVSTDRVRDLLTKMIEKDDTVLEIRDRFGRTGLHLAALKGNHEVVAHLIMKRVSNSFMNIQDEEGNTALMLAAGEGHKLIVELLLNVEASITLDGKNGRNILHVVIIRNKLEILKALMQQSKFPELLEKVDDEYGEPLHIAAIFNRVECLELLLCSSYMNNTIITAKFEGETPCHVAAKVGCLSILKLILYKYPSAANVRDNANNSPLYVSKCLLRQYL